MHNIILIRYLKNNYTVSYSVLNVFKNILNNKDFFFKNGYNVIDFTEFIDNSTDRDNIRNYNKNLQLECNKFDEIQLSTFNNFIKSMNNTNYYDNSILLFFPGYAIEDINESFLKIRNCKLYFWLDDLHTNGGLPDPSIILNVSKSLINNRIKLIILHASEGFVIL